MDPIALAPESIAAVIEWAVVSRPLGYEHGETISGDLHAVVPFADGVLVGVIDGLGHGTEADEAAKTAAHVLESDAAAPLEVLMQRCHEALRRTRGVVMTIAAFNRKESSLTWTGAGNVSGILVRADSDGSRPREAIITPGGVIGYQMPSTRLSTSRISRGDTLVLVTDGIRSDFTSSITLENSPQMLADAIMAGHWRQNDDALVFVARYVG